MRWSLLALDFDRTLTEHPRGLHPGVPGALASWRAAGGRVAVCSGQPLARLRAALPEVDGLAAENGAVVWARGQPQPWTHPWPERPRVVADLTAAGVPFTPFDVILDVPRAHEAGLRRALRPWHRAEPLYNVDSINLQPAGTTKGTGLARLQEALGARKEQTVAVGDGENDVAMFREAGLAVAVANATPEAKAAAHRVLELPDGEGVRALVEALLGSASSRT